MQLGSLQYPRNPMKGASEHFHFISVLAGGPGSAPRACFFRGLDPGCRAMFFVAAPWFSTSGGRLSEHFRDRNALGFARRRTSKIFQAGGTYCNSAKRELDIIAKPLRLLHESLLSGRSFLTPCAQKLATTLCPCSLSPAVCQFVLVAARRFLQSVTYFVGRAARALSPLCFRCVRFVGLRWCGSWSLVAGLGGWD